MFLTINIVEFYSNLRDLQSRKSHNTCDYPLK